MCNPKVLHCEICNNFHIHGILFFCPKTNCILLRICFFLQENESPAITPPKHMQTPYFISERCLNLVCMWMLQMNRLSLRNNRLKLETSGGLPIILEESIEEYTSNE